MPHRIFMMVLSSLSESLSHFFSDMHIEKTLRKPGKERSKGENEQTMQRNILSFFNRDYMCLASLQHRNCYNFQFCTQLQTSFANKWNFWIYVIINVSLSWLNHMVLDYIVCDLNFSQFLWEKRKRSLMISSFMRNMKWKFRKWWWKLWN